MRRLIVITLVALVVSACSTSSDDSEFGCSPANDSHGYSESEFQLSISSNPAFTGSYQFLRGGNNETPGPNNIVGGEAMTGYGSPWQCWTGTEWVRTHLLAHGVNEPGATMQGQPGVTSTVPANGVRQRCPPTVSANGYFVPFSLQITIPDVEPGWYRTETTIQAELDDGSIGSPVGHVSVEVSDHE